MKKKILVASLPIAGVWNSSEAASLLARAIRVADRTLGPDSLVQLPLVDGGVGTIDFLVTHSLGSFLEVEARDARGVDCVVPMGFAGEAGKLAVIEMSRVAGVRHEGERGTTVGVGELIQDALDEGAFSILLGQEEPLAFDAGLGAAGALGVRFFDSANNEIDFSKPSSQLSDIARVDASQRTFALLSSRLFLARSSSVPRVQETNLELSRIAEIILRDTGMHVPMQHRSPSAVELGLAGLLGAEIREGLSVVLEASGLADAMKKQEFADGIILIPSWNLTAMEQEFLESVRAAVDHGIVVCAVKKDSSITPSSGEQHFYFEDAPLFHAPLAEDASKEERQRDCSMRLEKIAPLMVAAWEKKSTGRSPRKSAHA